MIVIASAAPPKRLLSGEPVRAGFPPYPARAVSPGAVERIMVPKMPAPAPAPRMPSVDEARENVERRDMLRRAKGRAATYLSDEAGRTSGAGAAKALMGQGG